MKRIIRYGDLRQLYNRWHDQVEKTSSESSPWQIMARRWVTTVDLRGKNVIDMGCGDGNFVQWLASLPNRPSMIIAADFADVAIAKARRSSQEMGLTTIYYEIADILEIPHKNDTFDVIFCLETIEHTISPLRAIQELRRVLKPHGRLVLSCPNYLNASGLYRVYRWLVRRPYTEGGQPINRFLLLPFIYLQLRRSGFRILFVDSIGHYLPLPRPWSPIEIRFLNKIRIMKWFASHSFIVAEKLSPF